MASGRKTDPRVMRSRQLLRHAFLQLIGEKGYDAVSVQDITRQATLNRATFYLHYRDKADLLEQSIEEVLAELVAGMKKCCPVDERITDDADTATNPQSDLVYIFEHMARHAHFYKVMLGDKGEQHFLFRLLEVFVSVLRERIEQGLSRNIRPAVPKEILIQYAASAYLGVIAWWLRNGMPHTPEYMATQLTRLRRQHIQI